MLLHLDTSWLLTAVASVAVFSFFFGTALDAIMKDDGFGSTGNTLLFTVGFFVAVLVRKFLWVTLRDLKLAVAWGLGGAFMLISALALLEGGTGPLVKSMYRHSDEAELRATGFCASGTRVPKVRSVPVLGPALSARPDVRSQHTLAHT
jgi:hypothetical protein